MLKKDTLRRFVGPAAWLIMAAALLPLFLIAVYDRPSADDYSYGLTLYRVFRGDMSFYASMYKLLSTYYKGWQGSVSAMALMAVSPVSFGNAAYASVPFIMLGTLSFGTWALTRTLVCRLLGGEKRHADILSAILVFLQAELVPSPVQAFYWWNGAVYYTFFYSLMLLACERLLSLFLVKSLPARLAAFIPALLLFAFIGAGNYVTALLSAMILGLVCLYAALKNRRLLPMCLLLLAAQLATFYLSVSAPGNAVRQSELTRMAASRTVIISILQAGRDLFVFFDPLIPVLMLLIFPVVLRTVLKSRYKFKYPVLAVVFSFLMFAAQNAPHLYAASIPGPGRLRDIVFYAYIWLLFFWEFYLVGWAVNRHTAAGKRISLPGVHTRRALAALLVIAAVALTAAGKTTGSICVSSLRNGSAAQYARELDARENLYLDRDMKDIVLDPLSVTPEPLYFTDISVSMIDWTNQAVCNFYLKNTVVLKTDA